MNRGQTACLTHAVKDLIYESKKPVLGLFIYGICCEGHMTVWAIYAQFLKDKNSDFKANCTVFNNEGFCCIVL